MLKNVIWSETDLIPKTFVSFLTREKKEMIDNCVYVETTGKATKCWWCRLPLSKLVRLPIKLLPRGDYIYEGSFCSHSCAKAFALDNIPKNRPRYGKALALLNHVHRVQNNDQWLMPSPHWTLLQDYEGPLSNIQYKCDINHIGYELTPSCTVDDNCAMHIFREKDRSEYRFV